jgi:hypothetical protein
MTHLKKLPVIVLLLAVTCLAANKSVSVQFLVLQDTDGKPVRNAEIVLHPAGKAGKQKSAGLESKTHDDGKAEISGVPYGKTRVQVIAPGFKTYAKNLDINLPNVEVTVRLLNPAKQYSVYK